MSGAGPAAPTRGLAVWLDRMLLWGGAAAAAVAMVAGLVWPDPAGFRFLVVYTAPLLLFGPLWARTRLRQADHASRMSLALDALVFVLAALRLPGALLPHSGHALLLTYVPIVTGAPAFRLAAVALLAMTGYFKLWIWRDPASWTWGVGLGLGFAALQLWAGREAAGLRRPGAG